MEDCLYCKIVKEELPSSKLYENNKDRLMVINFDDDDEFNLCIENSTFASGNMQTEQI